MAHVPDSHYEPFSETILFVILVLGPLSALALSKCVGGRLRLLTVYEYMIALRLVAVVLVGICEVLTDDPTARTVSWVGAVAESALLLGGSRAKVVVFAAGLWAIREIRPSTQSTNTVVPFTHTSATRPSGKLRPSPPSEWRGHSIPSSSCSKSCDGLSDAAPRSS